MRGSILRRAHRCAWFEDDSGYLFADFKIDCRSSRFEPSYLEAVVCLLLLSCLVCVAHEQPRDHSLLFVHIFASRCVRYREMVIYASVMIGVFPFGIPVWYWWLLNRFKVWNFSNAAQCGRVTGSIASRALTVIGVLW